MPRIALIQISDTQFGPKCIFDPAILARDVSADVLQLSDQHSFIPTYIVVSGDVAESGNAIQFTQGKLFIESLCRELSTDLRNVLIVPGNHDLNWDLSRLADHVGDPHIKFACFDRFCEEVVGTPLFRSQKEFPESIDYRHGIYFMMLNSSEYENHEVFEGKVNCVKLLATLQSSRFIEATKSGFLKIAVLHHRLDVASHELRSAVSNAEEVDAILAKNGFQIALSGHVHCEFTHRKESDGNHVIYSGCGSTAIDKTQRPEGVPNQYTIHVLDDQPRNARLESYFRAYNPRSRSKFGMGKWTQDLTYEASPQVFSLEWKHQKVFTRNLIIEDTRLYENLGIAKNPFAVSNAEKISIEMISKLFVQDEERHRSALRLSGDAIIRGSRGSGKTMCLRYLDWFGQDEFHRAVTDRKIAECFPVFINLGQLHVADVDGNINAITKSAETMIVEQTIDSLDKVCDNLQLAEFRDAMHRFKQRLSILKNQEGSRIAQLGKSISEHLSRYFDHILLLIDEIAPIFPKVFFQDAQNGYGRWMNSIRNSGPFNTRIAVYPNDVADTLNEERFGTVVNLEFNPRENKDYEAFRRYAIRIFDQYLLSVAANRSTPPSIHAILELANAPYGDGLEQLLYASNGSSRRLVRLFEKCVTHRCGKPQDGPIVKEKVLEVIQEFSENLLSGYSTTEQQLANSLAKACKKAGTFRFRCPGISDLVRRICMSREETNLVALVEAGSGTRATTYEFNYPYCIQVGIPTHHVKDTQRIHHDRDLTQGEWIQRITGLDKEQLDIFKDNVRQTGIVVDIADDMFMIRTDNGTEFVGEESTVSLNLNDSVSFIAIEGNASDILRI